MDLKRKIALIIAIVIEALLLFVIFIILLIALLGAAMPFMPGLLFVALAALIYSFMVKIGYTRLTYRAHPYYFSAQSKILNLKITKKIMKLLKKIKKKKNEKIKEEILKHGLILIGFNLALILLFLFGFRGLSDLFFGALKNRYLRLGLLKLLVPAGDVPAQSLPFRLPR